MKLSVSCLVCVALALVVEGLDSRSTRSKRGFRLGASDRFSHGFGKRDQIEIEEPMKKAGFRKGAADRFSHGFGKRADSEYPELTVSELSELLGEHPSMRESIVKRHLDVNGDGYVSRHEMMGYDDE